MKIKLFLTSIFLMLSSLAAAEEAKHIYDTTETSTAVSLISEDTTEQAQSSAPEEVEVSKAPAKKVVKNKKKAKKHAKAKKAAKKKKVAPAAPAHQEEPVHEEAPAASAHEEAPAATGAESAEPATTTAPAAH